MIIHMVLFKWTQGVTDEQVDALSREVALLSGVIPEVKYLRFGRDIGLRDGNWDFGITAYFNDEAAWRVYIDHPSHQAVVAEYAKPIVAQRASLQMRLPE